MPLIFWLIGGAAALFAVAKIAASNALAGVTGTDKQLGTGAGAGSGAGAGVATQELSRDQKVALAKSVAMRWVYGEQKFDGYNTLELGAPGVDSNPGSASALLVLLGANMKDGHAILVNQAMTKVLVPANPGGELKYAASGSPWAIFLRPLEGKAIFEVAGVGVGSAADTDIVSVAKELPKAGEVKMLGAAPVRAFTPHSTAPAGSLDLMPAPEAPSGNAIVHAYELPDGEPIVDATGVTLYPLVNIRESYRAWQAGSKKTGGAYFVSASKLVDSLGYSLARDELYQAAITQGGGFSTGSP